MAWTTSWYLEQQIDGVWHQDTRPWIPSGSPVNLLDLSDHMDELEGLSFDVFFVLTRTGDKHFPHDPSVEVNLEVSRFIVSAVEELCMFPHFGWLLISDLLEFDWSNVVAQNTGKRNAIDQWLKHLASLGNPRHLRLIYMHSR